MQASLFKRSLIYHEADWSPLFSEEDDVVSGATGNGVFATGFVDDFFRPATFLAGTALGAIFFASAFLAAAFLGYRSKRQNKSSNKA